ncbi:MAG: serine/threonine-protein kinase [Proteobacteria bacterium]|nr:serine/threonine-protein kinase [Pseudomonadota bacterium]
MSGSSDDTAHDDTLVGDDRADVTSGASGPRIRVSRTTLSPRPNYPQLTEVDPAHYVFEREIARGGMGRILVARDRRLGREVAVKETLVSGRGARRFEREARITARLQHPSIIAVHEAGTWPTGEPFYAMRLVTGRSLDEAIGAAATYAERLALLPNVLAVADAMAYAHGQRVIHRDLKPRNVVVGAFGETVVIDWGLAKELDAPGASQGGRDPLDSLAGEAGDTGDVAAASFDPDRTASDTIDGEVLGTLAYMPPEQANAQAVDERADVYAIGAMLYHVLAGCPPFTAGSPAELLTAVWTIAPRSLRSIVPDVRTELAAIVERAMARDPAARYPDARALAEDLRRFQTGQLVGAHRYSSRQLLRRWLGRHRTAIAAVATAAIVGIVIGVAAIRRVVDAEARAQVERTSALAHRQTAEDLMQFMLVELKGKLAPIGKLDLLDAVARRAITYYDARDGDRSTATDEDVHLAAIARLGVGEVLEARGDVTGALAAYTKAAASLDALVQRRPEDARYELRAMEAAVHVADIHQLQGEASLALASYRTLHAHAERLLATRPVDVAVLGAAYTYRSRIGAVLERQGESAAALDEYRQALALAVRRADLDDTSSAQHILVDAHARVGRMLERAHDDLDGALAELRIGLAIGERQMALAPKDPHWIGDVAVSHNEVGTILQQQHDLVGALAEFRAGKAVADRAAAIDPSETGARSTQALLAEKLGLLLFEQHDLGGAAIEYATADLVWTELTARDPANLEWARSRSVTSNKLGDVRLATGDVAGALAAYRAALVIREKLVAKAPSNTDWRRDLFYSHYKLAAAARKVPDRALTIAALRAALVVADGTLAEHPGNERFADDAAETHDELGQELYAAGNLAGAEAELRAAVAIATRMAALPKPSRDWAKLIRQFTKPRAPR